LPLLALAAAALACAQLAGPAAPTPLRATTAAPAATPAVTSAATGAATAAPHGPATGADLSYAEFQAILSASFAAYPHRVRTTTVITGSSTSSQVIEATDLDHIHMTSTSTLSGASEPRETILISPTLYMKPPGKPWRLATPDEQGYTDAMIAATDPSKLMGSAPVTETDKLVYPFLGDETMNGVATARYHVDYTDADGTRTISDIWIGTGDQRIYQLNVTGADSYSTLAVEYDPSITVAAPMP
jgi:hypothetical protein